MKKKIYLFSLVIVSMIAVSCTTTYNITGNQGFDKSLIDSNKKIYIALPQDGAYNDNIYQNSGYTVQDKLEMALSKYVNLIVSGYNHESIDDAMNNAISKGASYLFYPTITHWEDRATAMSGIPDRVAIKIVVFDLVKKESIYRTELSAKGTSMTMSTTDPSDFLPELFSRFSQAIY
jgi:hypothetical protein